MLYIILTVEIHSILKLSITSKRPQKNITFYKLYKYSSLFKTSFRFRIFMYRILKTMFYFRVKNGCFNASMTEILFCGSNARHLSKRSANDATSRPSSEPA